MPEDTGSRMPRWWMDGSGPVALSWVANLIAVGMTWSRYGSQPLDGFGILTLISLLASVVAFDNCRDGTERHRSLIGGLAAGAFACAVVAAAVAYRGA